MSALITTDLFIRRVLWIAALFNVGGAILFAFPAAPLGQFVGLPTPVPAVYSSILAFLVLLFGATYGWLAMQPTVQRAFVGFFAIGKFGVFSIVMLFWLGGAIAVRGVLAAAGDLLFAALFFYWLRATAISKA